MDLERKSLELASNLIQASYWNGLDEVPTKEREAAYQKIILTFARAVERDTLERAAQVCDRHAADMGASLGVLRCRDAIRALIDAPPAPEPQDRSEPGVGRLDFVRLLCRAVISLLDTRGQPGDRERADDIGRAVTISFGDAEWILNEADSAAFVAAIENPPEPNAALKAAAERYKERVMPINPIDDAEFGTGEWRRDYPEAAPDPSVALAKAFKHQWDGERGRVPHSILADYITLGLVEKAPNGFVSLTGLGAAAVRIAMRRGNVDAE